MSYKGMIDMKIFKPVRDAAQKTTQALHDALEQDSTKAAMEWTKNAATVASGEVARLGKEVARSELVKDAATGAAIGAAVAVPIPLVGPTVGAVIGAGLGVYKNITRPHTKSSDNQTQRQKTIGIADPYSELLKLNELFEKGIVTESEFNKHKKKLLNNE